MIKLRTSTYTRIIVLVRITANYLGKIYKKKILNKGNINIIKYKNILE